MLPLVTDKESVHTDPSPPCESSDEASVLKDSWGSFSQSVPLWLKDSEMNRSAGTFSTGIKVGRAPEHPRVVRPSQLGGGGGWGVGGGGEEPSGRCLDQQHGREILIRTQEIVVESNTSYLWCLVCTCSSGTLSVGGSICLRASWPLTSLTLGLQTQVIGLHFCKFRITWLSCRCKLLQS